MTEHVPVHLPGARTVGRPNPAEKVRVTLGDKTFDAGRRTGAHLEWTIERLAVKHPGTHLHVLQPCFHTGVEASAGTHDADGVLDVRIDGLRWEQAQTFMRRHGWAAWWRHTGSWAAPSQWHVHAVSLGCPGLVGDLIPRQVDDYHHDRDGLAGHGPDGTWHPEDIAATVFDYERFIAARQEAVHV
jgi:hypothetical protein